MIILTFWINSEYLKIFDDICTYLIVFGRWGNQIPIGCYPSAVRGQPRKVSEEQLIIFESYLYLYLYSCSCLYVYHFFIVFIWCVYCVYPHCESVVYLVPWEPTSFPWVKGFYCLTNRICLLLSFRLPCLAYVSFYHRQVI